jgi:hypothetical protein
MLAYILWFSIGFIIDKVKNKCVGLFVQRSVKMLLYTPQWHQDNDTWRHNIYKLCEWVIL